MDPRAFVKISIGALGVRVPLASKPTRTGIHASTSPFFCDIRLPGYPTQTVPVQLIPPSTSCPDRVAASFYLDETAFEKLLAPSSCFSKSSYPCLEVLVFTGRQGKGKLVGTFSLPVDSQWLEGKPSQVHNGWVGIGKGNSADGKAGAELHLSIRIKADPRYIFQFDGQTVSSPQIVQIQGSITQPLFSVKFSRDSGRSRLGLCETPRNGKWSGPLVGCHEKERKERKGWLITIHDLSGSPVAAASIVTPFVPSSGSDQVRRSNPGAWLILRPESSSGSEPSWEPWGRLEAWKERGSKAGLGLRFQLVAETSGVLVSETVISSRTGGEFSIDTVKFRPASSRSSTPVHSPQRGSGDCSFNLGLPTSGGFVMSCTARNEWSLDEKPLVQLAMRHITCAEDAAVFMALAAAVDVSIDACQPFSRKLRKELS